MRERLLGTWKIWEPALKYRDNRSKFLITVGIINLSIIAPLYFVVNRVMKYRDVTSWDPTFSLDLEIPFLPWTIIFYSTLYFVFYPLPFFVVKNEKIKEVLVLSQSLIIAQLIAVFFFIFLPAEVHLRSQAVNGIELNPSWFGKFYEMLWAVDSPYNSWPSLHVIQAGLITFFTIRWTSGRTSFQISILILWILLSLSILTTKQHFIWDLITAVLLILVVWYVQVKPSLARF